MANTLKLYRNGAVGFIVWLGGSSPPRVYTEQDEGRRHENEDVSEDVLVTVEWFNNPLIGIQIPGLEIVLKVRQQENNPNKCDNGCGNGSGRPPAREQKQSERENQHHDQTDCEQESVSVKNRIRQ
jgi:hypothetical protein